MRGVLRLVLQRRLQVGGQDAAHPQGLRRGRRGRLERRHMIRPAVSSKPLFVCVCGSSPALLWRPTICGNEKARGESLGKPLFSMNILYGRFGFETS